VTGPDVIYFIKAQASHRPTRRDERAVEDYLKRSEHDPANRRMLLADHSVPCHKPRLIFCLKDRPVSPDKFNKLSETLAAACARQYGFNPRQIVAGMRYVGTEGHAKDIVHVFRAERTHSQIVLKGTFATLREKHGDKPHWSDTEKAHYQKSDAEIDAEAAVRQAELEFTRNSSLYQAHRLHLLSHYKAWPDFQSGRGNPREAALALIKALAEINDAGLVAYAKYMGSDAPEYLAHQLLAPCHLEFDAK
jgi:hypothetical protein